MKTLPKKRRKEALNQRARRYADTRNHWDRELPTKWECAYEGFNDGYRAAMADARRAFESVPHCSCPQMAEFLRPLR